MCFGLIFCLALLNIIDRDQVEIWRNTGYVSRYGMGYGHPNILHLTLFIVLTLNYYLNIEQMYSFLTASLKITSGEISAKEVAGESRD